MTKALRLPTLSARPSGTIPNLKQNCFSALGNEGLKEEARMEVSADPRRRSIVTAATGHHAPTSGWWRPDDDPEPFRYIQRGEIMPSLEATQMRWTLVHELDPSQRVRI